jgi:hypothetical protein
MTKPLSRHKSGHISPLRNVLFVVPPVELVIELRFDIDLYYQNSSDRLSH